MPFANDKLIPIKPLQIILYNKLFFYQYLLFIERFKNPKERKNHNIQNLMNNFKIIKRD